MVISVPISRGYGSRSDAHVTKCSFVQSDAIKPAYSNYYYTNLTIGSPPQAISLIIDTGSSDIWVPSESLTHLNSVSDSNFGLGFFDETRSSTYRSVPTNFSAAYQDGLSVTGTYMTDTLSVERVPVDALSMAIATNGSLAESKIATNRTQLPVSATGFNGIMGLGPSHTQANTSNCVFNFNQNCTDASLYCQTLQNAPCIRPGLLDRLVQQKAIASRAFSLYLDGLGGTGTGNILFGGIDTAKFEPPLLRVPIPTNYDFYVVNLTSVSASADTHKRSEPLNFTLPQSTVPIWLDSGSSVIAYTGAYFQPGLDIPLIPCAQAHNKSAITFGLGGAGGPAISVPISELVAPITYTNGSQIAARTHDSGGGEVCQFAIIDLPASANLTTDNTYIVGYPLLRSAYAVYNLDDWSISLAQARFNPTKSCIHEIKPNKTYNTSTEH